MAMPMKRPGRVSKTSTPSMAAIAATKSGRIAIPKREGGPVKMR
jgi:hypothetical protein